MVDEDHLNGQGGTGVDTEELAWTSVGGRQDGGQGGHVWTWSTMAVGWVVDRDGYPGGHGDCRWPSIIHGWEGVGGLQASKHA